MLLPQVLWPLLLNRPFDYRMTPADARQDPALLALTQITDEMQSAAQQGEWERVVELEALRRPQLEQFFSSLPSENQQAAWRALGERLLMVDHQILELAQSAKSEVAHSLQELNSSQQATAAYQSHQP